MILENKIRLKEVIQNQQERHLVSKLEAICMQPVNIADIMSLETDFDNLKFFNEQSELDRSLILLLGPKDFIESLGQDLQEQSKMLKQAFANVENNHRERNDTEEDEDEEDEEDEEAQEEQVQEIPSLEESEASDNEVVAGEGEAEDLGQDIVVSEVVVNEVSGDGRQRADSDFGEEAKREEIPGERMDTEEKKEKQDVVELSKEGIVVEVPRAQKEQKLDTEVIESEEEEEDEGVLLGDKCAEVIDFEKEALWFKGEEEEEKAENLQGDPEVVEPLDIEVSIYKEATDELCIEARDGDITTFHDPINTY